MRIIFFLSCLLFSVCGVVAQTSLSDNLIVPPISDRTVLFNVEDEGLHLPILWGLDTAWPSQENIRRGVAFMGAENIDVVRVSFQPTHQLIDGQLDAEQIRWINTRINLVNQTNPTARLVINCDHPTVHSWYAGNAARWAQLMDLTTRRFQAAGRTVVTISPFNEPDYGWGQGSITDFFNIAGELRKNPLFENIRISGGNTLNADQALPWYNQLKSRLDEGNTHQLAGSFNSYADFFTTVRANGHHASNDELHNVMEAMVGAEYGMQTGIWWGSAAFARSEFVKASKGVRLGYAEHRPNWTAASVYRHPDGRVQAFGGTSERQAVTTRFRFVSAERMVFFDGHGPQREYLLEMPGGTGYQQGQTNAERVVNISWGDDIQPVVNGSYKLVNRNSKQVLEVAAGSVAAGANVRQSNYTGQGYQHFSVKPVDPRIGEDFSYFSIIAGHSGKSLDVQDWSLQNGANIIVWDDAKGANQQWFLEYSEDGWFYIRSRHSSLCLEVANSSSVQFANVQQRTKTGAFNQQWRFVPAESILSFDTPLKPEGLMAEGRSHSVWLNWNTTSQNNLRGYSVFRSTNSGGPYEIIARYVKDSVFVDNSVAPGITYFYALKAEDTSLNRSEYSAEVSAASTGGNSLLSHYSFENHTRDASDNLLHAAISGSAAYTTRGEENNAVVLNGSSTFLQLPHTITNQSSITITAWVNFRGINSVWQRIFDFGSDEQHYLFLTPRNPSNRMRFAIRNGGAEQTLDAPALPYFQWSHVGVVMGDEEVVLYVNGARVAASSAISLRPDDVQPLFNYIGRSQFRNDPLLNAYIDDFKLYNYALSDTEIAVDAGLISSVRAETKARVEYWLDATSEVLTVKMPSIGTPSRVQLLTINGQLLQELIVDAANTVQISISSYPRGVYIVRAFNGEEFFSSSLVL
jgi:hypothetical protein